MKTEKQILERINKIDLLLSEDIGLSYNKISNLQRERINLLWVLSNEEKPIMPKKIGISMNLSTEDRIFNLLKSKPFLTQFEISEKLGTTVGYVSKEIAKLISNKRIESFGLGKRNNHKKYKIKIRKKNE